MSITIRDVAKESQVSLGTVSRVLHNKDNVNPELKERVQKAIKRLGYDPIRNIPLANRFKALTIGLVVPWINTTDPLDAFYGQAVLSLKRTLNEFNAHFTLFAESEVRERVSRGFNRDDLGADGLVFFCTNDRLDTVLRGLKKWGVQSVLVRRLTKVKGVISVTDRDQYGAEQAMEHLFDLGHRKIGLLTSGVDRVLLHNREQGYREFIRERQLPFQEHFFQHAAGMNGGSVKERMAGVFSGQEKPTALLCYSDYLAMEAVRVLADMGLRCPEDVSVVGWDDTDAGRHFAPSMTTIRIPVREMVSYAGRLIIDIFEGREVPVSYLEFQNELIIRGSTGPAGRTV